MRSWFRIGLRLAAPLALAGALSPSLAGAQADPLTIRVSNAEGEPGGPVTVILRTYASRPLSQGRLGAAAQPAGGRIGGAPAGISAPFASFDGGLVYGAGGDVLASLVWDDALQEVVAEFSSESAAVNAADGLLAELDFTLDPGAQVGAVYDLVLDLDPAFFLADAHGYPMPWTARAGELLILGPGSPAAVEVGGPKVHPGAVAQVEIETLEPFAVASGVLELLFPAGLLLEPVGVATDPQARHGSVTVTQVQVISPGRVRLEFFSPDSDFNQTPGTLFTLSFKTSASTPVGTLGSLTFDSAETVLVAPGPTPIALNLVGDVVEFVDAPGIFHDDFEWGTTGAWSYPGP